MLDVIEFGGPVRAQRRHVVGKAPRPAAPRVWLDPIQRKSMEASAPRPSIPRLGFLEMTSDLGGLVPEVDFHCKTSDSCKTLNSVAADEIARLQRAANYYAIAAGFRATKIEGDKPGPGTLMAVRGAAKYVFDQMYQRGMSQLAERSIVKNPAFATGLTYIVANAAELANILEGYAIDWGLKPAAAKPSAGKPKPAAVAKNGAKPAAAMPEPAPDFFESIPTWALALGAGGVAYMLLKPKKRAALGCPCEQ